MKRLAPVETKVASSAGAASLVALVLGLASAYGWFTPPPSYLTALMVSVVSGVAGWLAPHTPRPGDPVTVVTTSGPVSPQPAQAPPGGGTTP